MSLGQNTTPDASSSPKNPEASNEVNGYLNVTTDKLAHAFKSAKEGLDKIATKIDEHKGLITVLMTSLGALWAAHEIYHNPTEIARFASHTQLPTNVVNTMILSIGMGMTGGGAATTLYGGKTIANQVKKSRKRSAAQAELDNKSETQHNPPPQSEDTIDATNREQDSTTLDLNLSEALAMPHPTYVPGAHRNKRRKLNNDKAFDSQIVFNTPLISPTKIFSNH